MIEGFPGIAVTFLDDLGGHEGILEFVGGRRWRCRTSPLGWRPGLRCRVPPEAGCRKPRGRSSGLAGGVLSQDDAGREEGSAVTKSNQTFHGVCSVGERRTGVVSNV